MKKALILTVVGLVILGMGAYVLMANNTERQPTLATSPSSIVSEQNPPPTPKNNAVTVNYDNNGFSPQNIEITKGTTVNFINKSDIPLWVASDPHPAHTDYPEFDTPKVTGDLPRLGEDFSFTFEKTGIWKYHSHTASGDGGPLVHPGTITVK